MEFIKKFLPLLIVAIVFAVGGYFVGQGRLNGQGASLYKADILPANDAQKKCERKGWHWVGDGVGGFYCSPRVVTGTPATSVPVSNTVKATTTKAQ
jgi:hypothetical protein